MHLVDSDLRVHLAVDADRRSDTAGSDAAERVDGKESVLGGLSGAYAQKLRELVDHLLCSLYIACSSETAADDIFSLWFE